MIPVLLFICWWLIKAKVFFLMGVESSSVSFKNSNDTNVLVGWKFPFLGW